MRSHREAGQILPMGYFFCHGDYIGGISRSRSGPESVFATDHAQTQYALLGMIDLDQAEKISQDSIRVLRKRDMKHLGVARKPLPVAFKRERDTIVNTERSKYA